MLIVGLIAALSALVWGAALFCRGGLLAGCLAVLLAGTCFGAPFFSLPAGPVPLTSDRLLWVALLVQYLVWRRLGWAEPKPLGKAEYVMGALTAWLCVSTISHDWHVRGSQPAACLVFYYLMPLGLYWVARQSRLSEPALKAMFRCLAIFGVYLALTALAETEQAWSLVFPRYIASPSEVHFFGRGRGPFLNPVANGLVMTVCLAGLLMGWPRLGRWGQLAILPVSLIFALGIYATLTRCVWIGGVAALVIVVGLPMPRAWRAPLIVGSLLVVTAFGLTQWERMLAFKRDQALSEADTAESVRLRPILAAVAWNMFRDRPLAGCGFGHYRDEFVNYLADRSFDLPLEKARRYVQHNTFLALLTETGLIGASVFTTLLVIWGRGAWRLWHAPAAPPAIRQQGLLFLAFLAGYLPNAMFHDLSIIPMLNMLLFFLAGVTESLRPWACGEPR
ncbi:MAG TPA: O-antigen ligase family protein [Pirellulales bacterium]|nr:O-antigen ligase family protein [Pirellulales bacterium]